MANDDAVKRARAQRNCDLINQMLGGWFAEGAPLKEGMPGTKGPGPEAPDTSKLSAGELTQDQADQIEREGGVMPIGLPPAALRQELMQEARERRARKKRRKLQR